MLLDDKGTVFQITRPDERNVRQEEETHQQKLEKEIQTILCALTFSDIHFPDHYDEDKVHLNPDRSARNEEIPV